MAGIAPRSGNSGQARWFQEWTSRQRAEYAGRFVKLAEAGVDVDGEARLVDTLAGRRARILDAGCGTGRIAAYLHAAGHTVLGVDLDPTLVEAGRQQYPGVPLTRLDLLEVSPAVGTFELIVCAGNVIVYVEPGTERSVLTALDSVLDPGGRAVFGFATDRDYGLDAFDADTAAVGWSLEGRYATWQLDAFHDGADWAVSIFRKPPTPSP